MPTDLRDTTGARKGEFWGGFGIGCYLKQILSGTVCFPLGSEFGCGAEKEIGVEKEQSIELKIGGEAGGEHAKGMLELTVGTKTTTSEKWTAHSEKCDWCKPELCFPDSRVETWTCSTLLTLYYHDYDKTYFYPGPTSELMANCAEDKKKCKCSGTVAIPMKESEGPKSSVADGATHSMLLRPFRLERKDQTTPSSASEQASAFATLYQGDYASRNTGGRGMAIGIMEAGQPINWLYPANPDEPPRISVLSLNCGDARDPVLPASFRGRYLPLLAALRCEPSTSAEVSATVTEPGQPSVQVPPIPVEVRRGLYTLLWGEVDLGKEMPPRTNIIVELRLKSAGGCIAAATSAAYTVLA